MSATAFQRRRRELEQSQDEVKKQQVEKKTKKSKE